MDRIDTIETIETIYEYFKVLELFLKQPIPLEKIPTNSLTYVKLSNLINFNILIKSNDKYVWGNNECDFILAFDFYHKIRKLKLRFYDIDKIVNNSSKYSIDDYVFALKIQLKYEKYTTTTTTTTTTKNEILTNEESLIVLVNKLIKNISNLEENIEVIKCTQNDIKRTLDSNFNDVKKYISVLNNTNLYLMQEVFLKYNSENIKDNKRLELIGNVIKNIISTSTKIDSEIK